MQAAVAVVAAMLVGNATGMSVEVAIMSGKTAAITVTGDKLPTTHGQVSGVAAEMTVRAADSTTGALSLVETDSMTGDPPA